MTETPTSPPGPAGPPPPGDDQGPRTSGEEVRDLGRIRRSTTDNKVAGVAGGLARHLDVDPVILRVAFVVLTFFGGAGLIAYAAGWLLLPMDDGSEGVIRMEVVAANPEVATSFATHLISYAEDRVNNLSQQKRGDQMRDAMSGFETAQQERRAAQEALVKLQQQGAMLDPEGVIAGLRAQINNMEMQLQEKQLQLAALQDNLRPNEARVEGAKGDVRRIENLLAELNRKMIDASAGENSLAELTVRIQMAQADLATRDMMLQSALQQVEQTRMEANRQVRYLTTSVQPVASQSPSYPRSFEDTILAFLIFSGIYLMFSLTASILREQVTS